VAPMSERRIVHPARVIRSDACWRKAVRLRGIVVRS
jgi:hypothetical protein